MFCIDLSQFKKKLRTSGNLIMLTKRFELIQLKNIKAVRLIF